MQLETVEVFRTEGSSGIEGSSGWRGVTSGRPDVVDALDRTL